MFFVVFVTAAHTPSGIQIRKCFQCIIKSACEAFRGIDNLWNSGAGLGARAYSDYGIYMPKHYFRAFLHVLPLMWAPQEYWFRDNRILPLDVVKPLFLEINKLRQALAYILYLVLDKTMSGFRPKTSPCGGYPYITYEPRKPCNIGAMIRNAIECITGMFAFQDPVEDIISQRLKDHMQEDSDLHLPGGGKCRFIRRRSYARQRGPAWSRVAGCVVTRCLD